MSADVQLGGASGTGALRDRRTPQVRLLATAVPLAAPATAYAWIDRTRELQLRSWTQMTFDYADLGVPEWWAGGDSSGWFDSLPRPALLILRGVALTAVLSTVVVRRLFRPVVEPDVRWLLGAAGTPTRRAA